MKHNLIFSLLFPPRCIFCGEVLPIKGGTTSSACAKKLPYVEDGNILRKTGKYTCAVTFYYEAAVQQGIRALKFRGRKNRAEHFAPYLAQTVAEHLGGEFDAVTFVPVSPRRLRERGYDQSALLAGEEEEVWKEEIFLTVAHEFTHHLEETAGLHALDDKDLEFLQQALEEYRQEE